MFDRSTVVAGMAGLALSIAPATAAAAPLPLEPMAPDANEVATGDAAFGSGDVTIPLPLTSGSSEALAVLITGLSTLSGPQNCDPLPACG